MSDPTSAISLSELGARLKSARERASLTQANAAEAIGVARTTLVAIEKGERRPRIGEIQKLAALYDTSANAILREEAVHLDMVPRFRRLSETEDDDTATCVALLNDLVSAELELENALGIIREHNYPPARKIMPGDIRSQAEEHAQELRDWLGLGSGPVLDVISILELQIGIRVYLRPLPGKISGLFAFDPRAGACMLLNALHPWDRINQTASHELGHFNSTRNEPEVLTEDELFTSREERYANFFSRSFLTPARSVRHRFAEITAGQSHLTRRHIIILAHIHGVSREAMTRRLEELGLAKSGTWDWFQSNGGITNDQVKEVVGEIADSPLRKEGVVNLVPARLALLVREAWKRELYSEGQLVRLLHLDRHTVRRILDGIENEESEADDFVQLSH